MGELVINFTCNFLYMPTYFLGMAIIGMYACVADHRNCTTRYNIYGLKIEVAGLFVVQEGYTWQV